MYKTIAMTMRRTPLQSQMAVTQQQARWRDTYLNLKRHNIKYKSNTKEKRKQRKRDKAGNPYDATTGEQGALLQNMVPAKLKLLFKNYEMRVNDSRLTRKPMPDKTREELLERAKEYNEYKLVQARIMEEERWRSKVLEDEAYKACAFLPDYLIDEAWDFDQQAMADESFEYRPMYMYAEQILRTFPLDYQHRLRQQPGLNDAFMQLYDQDNQRESAKIKWETALIYGSSLLFKLL